MFSPNAHRAVARLVRGPHLRHDVRAQPLPQLHDRGDVVEGLAPV